MLKIEGLALLESLRAFEKVRYACFGLKLMDDYKECILNFKKVYLSLNNMSITPKIHVVFEHIIDFLKTALMIEGWAGSPSSALKLFTMI